MGYVEVRGSAEEDHLKKVGVRWRSGERSETPVYPPPPPSNLGTADI